MEECESKWPLFQVWRTEEGIVSAVVGGEDRSEEGVVVGGGVETRKAETKVKVGRNVEDEEVKETGTRTLLYTLGRLCCSGERLFERKCMSMPCKTTKANKEASTRIKD
jgi:hypothetical protein